MKRFCGIDPGKAGGIAWVNGDEYAAVKMPQTERDIWDTIAELEDGETFAMIECVRSSPQMGVKSAFTFGCNFGLLRMALIASGIPFEEVTPPVWQMAMRCRSGGDKNKTKAAAQRLFPALKMTHAIADSLLIAEYARRVRAG
jgi:Holliday junction resolvasome RuvABC endonuclease subunit